MSARIKKILYTILLFVPAAGFVIIGILAKYLDPLAVTIIISVYVSLWAALCYTLYRKIKELNDSIQLENLEEQIIVLPGENFLERCEQALLTDGFEKRIDRYADGEIEITATCFYRTIEKAAGKESDTVFFLEGVKAFSDLINTENSLRDSHLDCLDDPRLYKAFGQVIAIVSPYPDKEIYNFCVNSYYNQQAGILFLACDRDVAKAYFARPRRKAGKAFQRSESLAQKYIGINE